VINKIKRSMNDNDQHHTDSNNEQLFKQHETNLLIMLDRFFQVAQTNTFTESFFSKLEIKTSQKTLWQLFDAFEFPLQPEQETQALIQNYPVIDQHHQLAKELDLDWNLIPLKNNEYSYVFIGKLRQLSTTDVTTKELEDSKHQAEVANKSKLDFLANMSHELRNSLNGILGMTQILSMQSLPADAQHYVKDIYQSGNHLLSLVSDMLDFAKLEAGRLSFSSDPFNLRKVLSEVVEGMSVQCKKCNLDLFLDYCDTVPRHVEGDASRVRQIIINLITNAIKFTPNGHIFVAVEALQESNNQALLQITVEDTGIGIPTNKINQIFERYTQLSNQVNSSKKSGSGLGLAIVKQLVEKMGGEIGINSQAGHGATFWINLPFKLQDTACSDKNIKRKYPDLRLLLIDDNAKRGKVILKQMFGKNNKTVKSKASMDALMTSITQNKLFDIILIDDQTRHAQGFETLARQISAHPKFKNTMLCAISQESILAKYSQMFFHEICKPLVPGSFTKDLEDAWERWQVDQEIKGTKEQLPDSKIRVLIVEDNDMSMKVASIMFAELGCNITKAINGAQAIEQIQTPFDLIFLDIGLPDIDGGEVAKKFLSTPGPNQNTPLVALTAHALESDKASFLEMGINEVLTKPITFSSAQTALLNWAKHSKEFETLP
jgi:signal transduction histidine kinase/DNA-binding response OmpR family regulator